MPRLFSTWLCALALLSFSFGCRKDAPATPEPAGQLEGQWRVGLTDAVEYDAQDKVMVTYYPAAGIMDFTQLRITSTDMEYYHEGTNARSTTAYVRTGEQLTCPAPERSYTIRKLTARSLDLYLRGDYEQVGPRYSRLDLTIHLTRE